MTVIEKNYDNVAGSQLDEKSQLNYDANILLCKCACNECIKVKSIIAHKR